jgi:hypothetical protein
MRALMTGFRRRCQSRLANALLDFAVFALVFDLLSVDQPDRPVPHFILMYTPYNQGACIVASWPTRQASASLYIDVQPSQPGSLHCCLLANQTGQRPTLY